jgi:hypothetical protein
MSGGIPVKLLHEAEGHVVTCELKGGELSVSSPCLAHAPIAPSLSVCEWCDNMPLVWARAGARGQVWCGGRGVVAGSDGSEGRLRCGPLSWLRVHSATDPPIRSNCGLVWGGKRGQACQFCWKKSFLSVVCSAVPKTERCPTPPLLPPYTPHHRHCSSPPTTATTASTPHETAASKCPLM